MGIFTLIAAIVAAVGLAIIVAKLFERRFNRQLGLPITFEPSGDSRLRFDRIRLKATFDGDLALSYRVTNTTNRIIRASLIYEDFFTLSILNDRLRSVALSCNICLLPGESCDCEQWFFLSDWRKDCCLPRLQPLPDMCAPDRWTLICETTGQPLVATTTHPEGA